MYGVYKSQGVETWKRFLVHRNIPKRAIPEMETVYGKYGSNPINSLTEDQAISPLLKERHEGLEHRTNNKRGDVHAGIIWELVNRIILLKPSTHLS